MQKILFVVLLFLVNATYAENTQILKCRVSSQDWKATVTLDAIGTGVLKLRKTGPNKTITCDLNVEYIYDGQRDVSHNIRLEFGRQSCNSESGLLDLEILDRFMLIIHTTTNDKYMGWFQWLKRKQPDHCVVDYIRLLDFSMSAKKWKEGTWGRPQH